MNESIDYLPPLRDRRLGDRLHYYAPNDSLTLPYISPFWSRDLGNLPPLLIQVGGLEKLHDEIVEFASMAASYPENAPLVTLEVYKSHVHVFQAMFFCQASTVAFRRIGNFVKRVTGRIYLKRSVSTRVDLNHDGKVVGERPIVNNLAKRPSQRALTRESSWMNVLNDHDCSIGRLEEMIVPGSSFC
jgi:hypothetical protein